MFTQLHITEPILAKVESVPMLSVSADSGLGYIGVWRVQLSVQPAEAARRGQSSDWGSFSQRVATIQTLSVTSGHQDHVSSQRGQGHEVSSDNIMVSVVMVRLVSVLRCEPQ